MKTTKISNGVKFFKIIFLFLFLFPLSVRAVGVSINPSELDIVLPATTIQNLNIKNISAEPIVVSVYMDDFIDQISAVPNEFQLLPDEVGQVKIIPNFDKQASGVKKTNISVVAKAIDKRSFNAASGLKIPLTVHIGQQYWHWTAGTVLGVVFIGLLLLAFIVEIFFFFIRKNKKRKHTFVHNFLHYHKKKWW